MQCYQGISISCPGRLIINNSLKEGTQLPYIQRALQAGYGVLVLNTNDNRRVTSERKQFIRVREAVSGTFIG